MLNHLLPCHYDVLFGLHSNYFTLSFLPQGSSKTVKDTYVQNLISPYPPPSTRESLHLFQYSVFQKRPFCFQILKAYLLNISLMCELISTTARTIVKTAIISYMDYHINILICLSTSCWHPHINPLTHQPK